MQDPCPRPDRAEIFDPAVPVIFPGGSSGPGRTAPSTTGGTVTATSAQADPGPTDVQTSQPRRRIIVVDEPADAIRAVIARHAGPGIEVSTAPKSDPFPPRDRSPYVHGYKVGQKLPGLGRYALPGRPERRVPPAVPETALQEGTPPAEEEPMNTTADKVSEFSAATTTNAAPLPREIPPQPHRAVTLTLEIQADSHDDALRALDRFRNRLAKRDLCPGDHRVDCFDWAWDFTYQFSERPGPTHDEYADQLAAYLGALRVALPSSPARISSASQPSVESRVMGGPDV